MKKNWFKILSVVLAIVICAAVFSGCSVIDSIKGAVSGEPEKTPEELREDWLLSVKDKTVETVDGVEAQQNSEWNEQYTLWTAYPVVTDKATISAELEQYANSKIEEFKSYASQQAAANEKYKGSFELTYKPYTYGDSVISFKFTATTDGTSTEVKTFVYNLADETAVTVENIFNSESDYLTTLSNTVKQKLANNTKIKDNYNETAFNNGTAPSVENFANFVISDSMIVFYFPLDQISSYTQGGYAEAAISLDSLTEIMNSNFGGSASGGSAEGISDLIPEDSLLRTMFATSGNDMLPHSLDGIDPINDKVIAMTFDDGPNPNTTPKLLDALDEMDVKVTFFMTGLNATNNPDIVKRAYEAGHEIGDHSWNHEDFYELSTDEFIANIDKARTAISDACGAYPIIGRAPYGNISEEMAQTQGSATIYWSVDTEDWKWKDVDMDYENMMTAKDGDVVLQHDIHEPTVEAVIKAIRDLKAEGYKFVTVTQMMQIAEIRGKEPTYKFFCAY